MKLVISAVNFTEGGPLTVLREAVRAAADHFPDWEIVVAVHRIGITGESRVTEVAFPTAKASWMKRLWLEWVGFYGISREWKPDVWLSMHDITPRVCAGRQYVYCHNPAPFCGAPVPLAALDTKFRLFRRFYGLLYGSFISRNAAVIVQQEWLRNLFVDRYRVDRVIVAHPEVSLASTAGSRRSDKPSSFFYPAFPRVFKNFEMLGECVALLELDARWRGHITITIDGSENAYAAVIRERYGRLRSLRFAGLQPPQRMQAFYKESDALVFPSLLETWGLPLTEAKAHGLPILAADLPYAHETVGSYDRVSFFDPTDAAALASKILAIHLGETSFGQAVQPAPADPYANGWKQLLQILLVEDGGRLNGRPASG